MFSGTILSSTRSNFSWIGQVNAVERTSSYYCTFKDERGNVYPIPRFAPKLLTFFLLTKNGSLESCNKDDATVKS